MEDKLTDIVQYLGDSIAIQLPDWQDYSEMLHEYGFQFQEVDYTLLIGEPKQIQGWVLHLSVVISKLQDLLTAVLPLLHRENVPFKLARDKSIAKDIQEGNLGIEQFGKFISIYPENDDSLVSLAKQLIKKTQDFKGPEIPTDKYLGGVVYTRYGSIQPILDLGKNKETIKCIYDAKGNLIKDPYTIPFKLPEGIKWPFGDIASPEIPARKKILKVIYKPLTILKSDMKGDVFKGIYLKRIFRLASCVIKEGKKCAVSDETGRTIHDRLVWQYELHSNLSQFIPLPKVYDLFIEDENTYLAMEYINGISLYDRLKQVNFNIRSWYSLSKPLQIELVDYILQIIDIVIKLHSNGYIHRDIAPGNFLINRKMEIVLIDLELAYSVFQKKPMPPFEYGTTGFMSPEQKKVSIPTEHEDIYGLGALISIVMTGLLPVKFNTGNLEHLSTNLNFFLGDKTISTLIINCFNAIPELRPGISRIKSTLEDYKKSIDTRVVSESIFLSERSLDVNMLNETIELALPGLFSEPIVMRDNFWYSRVMIKTYAGLHPSKEYTKYVWLHTGIGGILYFLARIYREGYNIDNYVSCYYANWSFIDKYCAENSINISNGLYFGNIGLAIALAEGINAGLIEDNTSNREKIYSWLSLSATELNMANGVAGQAMGIMRVAELLEDQSLDDLLNKCIDHLLYTQEKDGSWAVADTMGQNEGGLLSFGYGVPGIIFLLLAYTLKKTAVHVRKAAQKAIGWLLKKTNNLKDLFKTSTFKKALEGPEFGDERKGILLTIIKAYEVLNDSHFKTITENALRQYPMCILKNNYTQDTGLAGLGELYLEAYRVFKTSDWKKRADWIANVYIHTSIRNPDGFIHWALEENTEPTADFMTGNSGIIHFLIRCNGKSSLRYRLLD